MSVTVSVIVPVHTAARHAGRALGSVLATRIPDGVTVELIVVDDASASSLEFLLRDAPFPARVVRHDAPRGPSTARNTGLAAATGDYVWFVGGVDWVDPGLLAALTSAAPDADIVVAGTVPVTEDGVTGPPLPRRATGTVWTGPPAVEEFLFQRIRAGVTNKLVSPEPPRRALVPARSAPRGRHPPSWRGLLRARTVAYVAGPAYFHLRRPVAGFNPRVADRAAAVDEALFVLSGAGPPGGSCTSGSAPGPSPSPAPRPARRRGAVRRRLGGRPSRPPRPAPRRRLDGAAAPAAGAGGGRAAHPAGSRAVRPAVPGRPRRRPAPRRPPGPPVARRRRPHAVGAARGSCRR